jgi:hypothetical protein
VSSTTMRDDSKPACTTSPVKEHTVFIWQEALGARHIPDAVVATKLNCPESNKGPYSIQHIA